MRCVVADLADPCGTQGRLSALETRCGCSRGAGDEPEYSSRFDNETCPGGQKSDGRGERRCRDDLLNVRLVQAQPRSRRPPCRRAAPCRLRVAAAQAASGSARLRSSCDRSDPGTSTPGSDHEYATIVGCRVDSPTMLTSPGTHAERRRYDAPRVSRERLPLGSFESGKPRSCGRGLGGASSVLTVGRGLPAS